MVKRLLALQSYGKRPVQALKVVISVIFTGPHVLFLIRTVTTKSYSVIELEIGLALVQCYESPYISVEGRLFHSSVLAGFRTMAYGISPLPCFWSFSYPSPFQIPIHVFTKS